MASVKSTVHKRDACELQHSVDWGSESQCMRTVPDQSKHLDFAIVAGGSNSEVDRVKADHFHAIIAFKHLGIGTFNELILQELPSAHTL